MMNQPCTGGRLACAWEQRAQVLERQRLNGHDSERRGPADGAAGPVSRNEATAAFGVAVG
jgi:hypothetical protein